MAKVKDVDNYTRPEDKARWGFGGTIDNIAIASPEDAAPVASVDVVPAPRAAVKNGGGEEGTK